jgi:hypothetical protein
MGHAEIGSAPNQRRYVTTHWARLVLIASVALVHIAGSGMAAAAVPSPAALEVRASEKAFNISTAAAERNVAIQKRGEGIVDQLRAIQTDQFAGVWFDGTTGEFVVPVTSEALLGQVKGLLRANNLEGNSRTHPVQSTWEELEAAQAEMDKALHSLIRSELAQTSLDPRTNAVVVYLAKNASPRDEELVQDAKAAQRVGVEIRLEPVPQFQTEPMACNQATDSCDKPLRGGVYIENSGPTVFIGCSTGFKATGIGTGNRYMLTAGHCYAKSADWRAWNSKSEAHYVGHADAGSFPGSDWARIQVNGYGTWWEEGIASWPSQVVYWGVNQSLPIESESQSFVGQIVCHTGNGSKNSSCGPVVALDKTIAYPDGIVYHMTEVHGSGWFVAHGDSGGPVWSGTSALGLLSGGSEVDPTVGLYQEVTEATEALGVRVGTRITPPPTASTGNPTTVRERAIAITGTVNPNGSGTSYKFEYGATTSYGNSTALTNVGYGKAPVPVSAVMGGLHEGSAYHYRLVATNSQGTSYGADRQVSTMPGSQASHSAVRDPIAGNQWIYYRGSNSRVCLFAVNYSTGWSNSCPEVGPNIAASTSPSVMREPSNGELWAYYNSSAAQICGLLFSFSSGSSSSCLSGGQPAAAGASPAALRDPGNGEQWVYYTGSNSRICGWVFQSGGWSNSCLATGQAVASGASPTVLRDSGSLEQWVYYAGSNSAICGWVYQPNTAWANSCLSSGQSAAAATTPSAVRDELNGAQWVYYTGSNAAVCAYVNTPSSGWANSCLASGQPVMAGTSPTAVRDPASGEQWVYYTGSNAALCAYVYLPSSGWVTTCLGSGQAVAAGASPMAVLRDAWNGEQWIYYRGANSRVCLYHFQSSPGWTSACPEGGQNAG